MPDGKVVETLYSANCKHTIIKKAKMVGHEFYITEMASRIEGRTDPSVLPWKLLKKKAATSGSCKNLLSGQPHRGAAFGPCHELGLEQEAISSVARKLSR